ncbi:MAG TPA: ATP-dependent Clp protease ATP-binding subunit [Candidatus Saccharimonadales bacterium]|nr:ATP-dependent Clp protease ATP-binding subunit [Candidatus Saccharimonadales bacterium]
MSRKINEKFTERAKRALFLAAREAKNFRSPLIDTEHILLGILADNSSGASRILASYQLDIGRVRETVLASSDPKAIEGETGAFTEAAQEAIASSALQAYLQGNSFVGTEHLLAGLSKTTSGLACHILRSWGLTYEIVKNKLEGGNNASKNQATFETQTPLLNTYGRDLTELALEEELDPVISRETEIDRVIQILSRRTKNNPILLGEAGVGKTAIVEGLAQKIINREVPQRFFDTRLINLDLNALVAGTRFRGDFEERLLGVLEEIRDSGNIILFIDEIHTIIGAGGAGGALDAANILKPALARGELRCIGATTTDEYSEFIEEDSALERRFQPIIVAEPDEKTAVGILQGLKSRYESFHGVKIKKTALVEAVALANRYLVDRHLPDSAIDVIDEAASKKAVTVGLLPKTAIKIEESLEELREEKEKLIKNEHYEEAVDVREKEENLIKKLKEILQEDSLTDEKIVDEKDVAKIVSTMTGVPVEELTSSEADKLLNLEKDLEEKVVGQNEVIKTVASIVRRSRVGLTDSKRPIASFIFLGTSGVGKTLLAKSLAETLFGDSENLIRLDMSEFSESHTVARLVGAPPGYVGFEEGGELTDKLKHHPYSIILLDEIEKAHSEVFNILLQVLEDGQLTDGRGKVTNFRNSVLIMTSNVGSHLIKKEGKLGFTEINVSSNESEESDYANISQKLIEELKKRFKVEFLNRVDSTLVFRPLNKEVVEKIARILLKDVKTRLKALKIKVEVSENVYRYLATKGFSSEYGARELRRLIQDQIENPLSEKILSGEVKSRQKVKIKLTKGQIQITPHGEN